MRTDEPARELEVRSPLWGDPRERPGASLSWLYLVAAVLGPVTLIAPHYPGTDVAGILGLSIAAALGAVGLRRWGHRMGTVAVSLAVAAGSVMTTAAIHFTQGVPNASAVFYLWVALYAAYFLSRRMAAAQVTFAALCYAVAIALRPPETPVVAHWLTSVVGWGVAAGLVSVLKERLDGAIADLAEVARTDKLTGLRNRRGFDERLEIELEVARRSDQSFSIVVCDLDSFKQANDRFGHPAGDEILCTFADILDQRRRVIDTVARLGGDEFALILPSTDAAGAHVLAGELRRAVSERLTEMPAGCTASFGIASYPAHAEAVDSLVRFADMALYAAKSLGGDRVVIFDDQATFAAIAAGEVDSQIVQPPA